MLDAKRAEFGPDYDDRGLLFCWEDGRPPHPDTISRRFHTLSAPSGLPKINWKALSQRISHAHVAFTVRPYVQADLEADRQVANTPPR